MGVFVFAFFSLNWALYEMDFVFNKKNSSIQKSVRKFKNVKRFLRRIGNRYFLRLYLFLVRLIMHKMRDLVVGYFFLLKPKVSFVSCKAQSIVCFL